MQLNGVKNLVVDASLPENILSVGEEKFALRYDFAAFDAYLKLTGVNPFTRNFTVSQDNLVAFLWAGLYPRYRALTLEDVQEWVTPSNVRAILEFVGEAYFSSFPSAPAEGAGEDPPSA